VNGPVPIESMIRREVARVAPAKGKDSLPREFRAWGDDRYSFAVNDLGISIEVDRLRRERGELIGELSVRCELPGARVVNGASLSVADLNLSSARSRGERAKLLAGRANIKDLDWLGLVEDFCQRVLDAERVGLPAVDLREVPRPDLNEATYEADGFAVPKDHPTIIFGDGGTCKSLFALRFAGRLSERGIRVGYFDWELGPGDHRDRLERLFGDTMPRILYARCERPLIYEADRLRRIVRENGIGYAIFDSVAFASDGPPESAEIAGKYFRAVRQIGIGSLHIAHITKGENSDKRPFGSAFWHNGARSTWFIQLAEGGGDSDSLQVGLFNRKSNLGRLRPPLGYAIRFEEDRTLFRRADVADNAELAVQMTIRQRMAHMLKGGAYNYDRIAEELEADIDTVKRTARRYKNLFVILDGGRVGLSAGGAK